MAERNDIDDLSPLLDGELSEAERERLEQRLADDSSAKEELDDWRRIDALYRAMPPESAPEGFEAGVRQAIQRESAPAKSEPIRLQSRVRTRRAGVWPALAAAAMLLVALGAVFYMQGAIGPNLRGHMQMANEVAMDKAADVRADTQVQSLEAESPPEGQEMRENWQLQSQMTESSSPDEPASPAMAGDQAGSTAGGYGGGYGGGYAAGDRVGASRAGDGMYGAGQRYTPQSDNELGNNAAAAMDRPAAVPAPEPAPPPPPPAVAKPVRQVRDNDDSRSRELDRQEQTIETRDFQTASEAMESDFAGEANVPGVSAPATPPRRQLAKAPDTADMFKSATDAAEPGIDEELLYYFSDEFTPPTPTDAVSGIKASPERGATRTVGDREFTWQLDAWVQEGYANQPVALLEREGDATAALLRDHPALSPISQWPEAVVFEADGQWSRLEAKSAGTE